MVKIALAGGFGDVASELLEVLVATKKHDILILTRSSQPKRKAPAGVAFVTVDYNDPEQLAAALKDVHTLLSFVSETEDPTSPVQKQLIDACVRAGVKRFAPSEWASSKLDYLDWYGYKGATRAYLQKINKDKKVLEYTLFQPGLFSNYLTFPHASTNHLHLMDLPLNLNDRRFITLAGGDESRINFVTVQDLAQIVARAIDFEGEWPTNGGIRGSEISIGELIRFSEKIRGGKFDITRLERADILAGEWKAPWAPLIDHPSFTREQAENMSKFIAGRLLLAAEAGAYQVEDSWNRLFPEYNMTKLEDFLAEAWRGKP